MHFPIVTVYEMWPFLQMLSLTITSLLKKKITDLQLLFGNLNGRIISALMRRFDGLPIHQLVVYYQSYNQGMLQILMLQ